MSEIQFDVKVEPISATHQSSLRVLKTRSGRFFIGKCSNSKIKRWLALFESAALKHKPSVPFEKPCSIYIGFYFKHLKSVSKAKAGTTFFKTTRPDLDNLEKSVLDSLVRMGFLVDDSIVCNKTTEKFHSPDPRISIILREMP